MNGNELQDLADSPTVTDSKGVPKHETITDAIRRAILEAPISRYELSRRVGVTQATLSGFVNGKHGIGSELLDRVAAELGMRIVVGKPKRRKQP